MIEIMSREEHENLHKTSLKVVKGTVASFEKGLPTEIVTLDTRHDSHETVDKEKRYRQIVEILTESDKPLTAKQIAVLMNRKGYTPTAERNFSAPRLTELSQKGVVEPIGKQKCEYTGKTVAVYSLIECHD